MNNNIQEQLVSFETAKLLKEKGARLKSNYNHNCNETEFYHKLTGDIKLYSYFNTFDNMVSVPTQQLAIDWIRVNFNLHIGCWFNGNITESINLLFCYDIKKIQSTPNLIKNQTGFNTPEEAKEAAIQYCLNNLINIKMENKKCKGFILIKEYPRSKGLGYFEPYTTGELLKYPEFWLPIYK